MNYRHATPVDSLRGSSVKIGTIQMILAWPLRKDDTHKSRSVNIGMQRRGPYARGTAAAVAPMARRAVLTYIYIYIYII